MSELNSESDSEVEEDVPENMDIDTAVNDLDYSQDVLEGTGDNEDQNKKKQLSWKKSLQMVETGGT